MKTLMKRSSLAVLQPQHLLAKAFESLAKKALPTKSREESNAQFACPVVLEGLRVSCSRFSLNYYRGSLQGSLALGTPVLQGCQ